MHLVRESPSTRVNGAVFTSDAMLFLQPLVAIDLRVCAVVTSDLLACTRLFDDVNSSFLGVAGERVESVGHTAVFLMDNISARIRALTAQAPIKGSQS